MCSHRLDRPDIQERKTWVFSWIQVLNINEPAYQAGQRDQIPTIDTQAHLSTCLLSLEQLLRSSVAGIHLKHFLQCFTSFPVLSCLNVEFRQLDV